MCISTGVKRSGRAVVVTMAGGAWKVPSPVHEREFYVVSSPESSPVEAAGKLGRLTSREKMRYDVPGGCSLLTHRRKLQRRIGRLTAWRHVAWTAKRPPPQATRTRGVADEVKCGRLSPRTGLAQLSRPLKPCGVRRPQSLRHAGQSRSRSLSLPAHLCLRVSTPFRSLVCDRISSNRKCGADQSLRRS